MTQNELKTAFDAVDQDMVNDKVMMNLAMEVAQKALTPDGKIRPAEELLPLMVDTISNTIRIFCSAFFQRCSAKSNIL